MLRKVLKILAKTLLILAVCISGVAFCLVIAAKSERTSLCIADKQLFAHRGQATKAVENTFEAMRMAVEEGYTAIETDVRFTRDGVAVLFHDETLERLCKKEGTIEQLDFNKVRKLHLYQGNEQTESTIATLESVFEAFPNTIFYLDIKEPTMSNLKRVSDIIHAHKMEQKAIVAHAKFIPHLLHRIEFPDIVSCDEGFDSGKEWLLKLLPEKLQSDYYSGFIHKTDLKQMNRLAKWKQRNRKMVYGVDESNIEQAAFEYGLHYMIADLTEPQKYLDKIEKQNQKTPITE